MDADTRACILLNLPRKPYNICYHQRNPDPNDTSLHVGIIDLLRPGYDYEAVCPLPSLGQTPLSICIYIYIYVYIPILYIGFLQGMYHEFLLGAAQFNAFRGHLLLVV